jgi:hypothetical protein
VILVAGAFCRFLRTAGLVACGECVFLALLAYRGDEVYFGDGCLMQLFRPESPDNGVAVEVHAHAPRVSREFNECDSLVNRGVFDESQAVRPAQYAAW